MGVEFIRFDMSEYVERHAVSRLIGAPPGYVGFEQGGLLTEAVIKNPHAVVLLDEIEKAHPDIYNILLQVMDHGTLTDNNGRKADFRNVVLVMTTNAGVQETVRKSIGFTEQDHSHDAMSEINKVFSPEFRNRLDNIIWFNHLDKEVILQVVDKFIVELQAQLDKNQLTLNLHPKQESGWQIKAMIKRWVHAQWRVLSKMSKSRWQMQSCLLADGGSVKVSVKDKKIHFDFETSLEKQLFLAKNKKPSNCWAFCC